MILKVIQGHFISLNLPAYSSPYEFQSIAQGWGISLRRTIV